MYITSGAIITIKAKLSPHHLLFFFTMNTDSQSFFSINMYTKVTKQNKKKLYLIFCNHSSSPSKLQYKKTLCHTSIKSAYLKKKYTVNLL